MIACIVHENWKVILTKVVRIYRICTTCGAYSIFYTIVYLFVCFCFSLCLYYPLFCCYFAQSFSAVTQDKLYYFMCKLDLCGVFFVSPGSELGKCCGQVWDRLYRQKHHHRTDGGIVCSDLDTSPVCFCA